MKKALLVTTLSTLVAFSTYAQESTQSFDEPAVITEDSMDVTEAPEPEQRNFLEELLDLNAIDTQSDMRRFERSGGVGNGGDAVICPDEIVMLDTYEARKYRFKINLNPSQNENPTWRSMVNVAVQRLQRFDETLATKLYDYAMEMVNDFEKFELYPEARGNAVYLGKDVIAEINDSAHVSVPEGCVLRQFISQRTPRFSRDYRYEFSQSIWERMNTQEQTMAILHEAWYRIMLDNGAKNSIAARYMNGLVASDVFDLYTFEDYINDIQGTEIRTYSVRNESHALKQDDIVIKLKEHDFDFEEGMLCAPNFKIEVSLKKPYNIGAALFGQEYLGRIKFQNVCLKNSRLRKLVLPVDIVKKDRILRLPFAQVYFKEALSDSPSIHFNEKGKLTHLSDIQASHLYRMFYTCNGVDSFDQSVGCEEGPFNHGDSVVKNTSIIEFDQDEKLKRSN
ncbi:MAG: hypothetical protein CME62_17730 [Halobacteriovoraceae bacterium]|nr:hypothetical protein [Halobacteriovoraceae bacterium]|tara:strand:- start:2290 stop:3642 length:1353 start_codon:yes stop_codon:yes gene_type:complete